MDSTIYGELLNKHKLFVVFGFGHGHINMSSFSYLRESRVMIEVFKC